MSPIIGSAWSAATGCGGVLPDLSWCTSWQLRSRIILRNIQTSRHIFQKHKEHFVRDNPANFAEVWVLVLNIDIVISMMQNEFLKKDTLCWIRILSCASAPRKICPAQSLKKGALPDVKRCRGRVTHTQKKKKTKKKQKNPNCCYQFTLRFVCAAALVVWSFGPLPCPQRSNCGEKSVSSLNRSCLSGRCGRPRPRTVSVDVCVCEYVCVCSCFNYIVRAMILLTNASSFGAKNGLSF